MKEKIATLIAALKQFGFIRVDGLLCTPPLRDRQFIIKRGEIKDSEIAVDHNNGKDVVVLPDGSVWLGVYYQDALIMAIRETGLKIRNDAYVPCSNGETISLHDLLARNASHTWTPPYHTSDLAQAAGF